MQRLPIGLLLEGTEIGELIAELRRYAMACHKTDPELTALAHKRIDWLEHGQGHPKPGTDLIVHGGHTFLRNAIRLYPQGNQVLYRTQVGELNGARVYCREREGRTKVILTQEDLYE